MDFMKDLIDTASNISKKTDYIIKIGECKMDIRHCQKEIDKRKVLLGEHVYNWFAYRNIDIKELPKLCREILDYENEIGRLNKEVANYKKYVDDQ